MELKKWPETELGYWEVVEGLGGIIFALKHDLGDGRIESNPDLEKDIQDAHEISSKLVEELCKKFKVIIPGEEDSIPEGYKPYWKWYEEMKKTYLTKKYNGIICSVCPFSKGLEASITGGVVRPCSVKHMAGAIHEIPFRCEIVGTGKYDWTEEMLHQRIEEEAGQEALDIFLKKQEEIKKQWTRDKDND